MNKTWEDIKAIWLRISLPVLFLFAIGLFIAYLYEPFPLALNAFLISGDLIPLILLFDVIGILLCFVIAGILISLDTVKWAWFPFALGTVFVLPKLAVLHLGLVEDTGFHFLSAYIVLSAVAPLTYIGWLISRTAVEYEEDGDN